MEGKNPPFTQSHQNELTEGGGEAKKTTQENHEQKISTKKTWSCTFFLFPGMFFFSRPPLAFFCSPPSVSESSTSENPPQKKYHQGFTHKVSPPGAQEVWLLFVMYRSPTLVRFTDVMALGEKNFKNIYIYVFKFTYYSSIFMCKKIFASHIAV